MPLLINSLSLALALLAVTARPVVGEDDDDDDVPSFEDKLASCQVDFSCQDYKKIVAGYGENLDDVLGCLEYNRYVSPAHYIKRNNLTDAHPKTHEVTIYVDFKKIIALETATHTLHIDFEFYLLWNEPRFNFGSECYDRNQPGRYNLNEEIAEQMWLAPIALRDMVSMKVRNSFRSGVGYEIFDDGHLLNWGRYDALIDCAMDFSYFPFDAHTCKVDFYLDKGNASEITLKWNKNYNFDEHTDKKDLFVPNWNTETRRGEDFLRFNKFAKEWNSGVSTEFDFVRVWTVHFMHTFVPSIMISLSSVCSVFVPSDLVPGRMGLCITAFLSMISLFNGARENWPMTSYMKAIDVWTGGCYFTVFTALIEYCVVLYLTKTADWQRKIRKYHQSEAKKKMAGGAKGTRVGGVDSLVDRVEERHRRQKIFDAHGELIRRKELAANRIETGSRILLPAYFVLFNFIYWVAVFA